MYECVYGEFDLDDFIRRCAARSLRSAAVHITWCRKFRLGRSKGLAESLGTQYHLCAISETGAAVLLSLVMLGGQKPRVTACELGSSRRQTVATPSGAEARISLCRMFASLVLSRRTLIP
jgi:hypothetical protein